MDNERVDYNSLLVPLVSAVFDLVPLGLLMINKESQILAANSSIAEMVKKSKKEMEGQRIGKSLGCICSGIGTGQCGVGESCCECPLNKIFIDVIEQQKPVLNRCIAIRLMVGGYSKWVDLQVSCVPFLHGLDRLSVVVISDVSEIRNLERSLILDMDRFSLIGINASQILHDLNNPLSAISGYSELILLELSKADNPNLVRQIDAIQKATNKMVTMVKEITALASGINRAPIELSSIHIDELLNEFLDEQQFKTPITREFNCPLPIKGNKNRIEIIIWNLIKNADEALVNMANPRIVVRTTHKNDFACVQISDNGPGIPESIRDNLFIPGKTYGKTNGHGLGLSGSKRMAAEMMGDLTFESSERLGTTFVLTLPIA